MQTTRIIGMRRAALKVSCYGRKPEVRVAFDVGLRTGLIAFAYRFDDKIERKGATRVRGQSRNIIVIDYRETAAAFLADLTTSATLRVKASRPPFELHEADFRWDRADPILRDVLAACEQSAPRSKRRQEPVPDPPDDDEALDDAIKNILPEDQQ